MKTEVGKTYRTRGGKKAVVEFIMPEPSRYASRWIARIQTNEGWAPFTYKEDGVFGAGGGEYDLVSEWSDKPEWCKLNPKWARFQAHDEDGDMKFYERSTEPLEDRGQWKWDNGGDWGYMPEHLRPPLPPGCRWQDSLVEAPKGWGEK